MDNKIKYLYKKHIHDNAPDMDKLWDRIEKEIDGKTQNGGNDLSRNKKITQTKRTKKSYKKFTAAAASLLVIIGGISLYADLSSTMNNETGSNKNTYTSSENDTNHDYSENNDTVVRADMSYEQLSFSRTETAVYNSEYKAAGDEYFTEQSVLSQTDCFADVTVLSAELGTDSAQYTLKINRLISRSGETEETNITLQSSTPYILQENREYFIPLRKENNDYFIVFENAPQIEITLDNEIVFQNGWNSLTENSGTLKKSQANQNDYYYDRMRYAEENDLEKLIEEWKSL